MTQAVSSLHGSCLCKSIEFKIETPTLTCSHCHCDSCRKAHSAAFVTWTSFEESQLSFIKGQDILKKYQSSPNVSRSFCGNCGSPLFYKSTDEGQILYVPTSTLSNAPDVLPTRHVSYEEKVVWLDVDNHLPKYFGKSELIGEK